MRHYTNGALAWEASNLDCAYVQEYLNEDNYMPEGGKVIVFNDSNGTWI